jgi:hypothetical protein
MAESKFEFYSLGYVTKDIEEDDLWVEVYPIEKTPTADGNIDALTVEDSVIRDLENNTHSIKINKTYKITAKWINESDSNRITPPNVCAGETIRIFRYAGTDKYFWSTLYNELDLRKLEKATYVYSNKRSIKNKSLLDKVYYWTIDTINKYVRLHTDDSDGELTTYDFEIDTKNGTVTLKDGKDNAIILESDLENLNFIINNDLIEDIGNNKIVTLKKLSITNDVAELISTLSELVQANIDESHIGNLGLPTSVSSGSVSKYKAIKDKIDSFKI